MQIVRCDLRPCIQVWVVARRAVLHVHDMLDRVRTFTQVGVGELTSLCGPWESADFLSRMAEAQLRALDLGKYDPIWGRTEECHP